MSNAGICRWRSSKASGRGRGLHQTGLRDRAPARGPSLQRFCADLGAVVTYESKTIDPSGKRYLLPRFIRERLVKRSFRAPILEELLASTLKRPAYRRSRSPLLFPSPRLSLGKTASLSPGRLYHGCRGHAQRPPKHRAYPLTYSPHSFRAKTVITNFASGKCCPLKPLSRIGVNADSLKRQSCIPPRPKVLLEEWRGFELLKCIPFRNVLIKQHDFQSTTAIVHL